MIFYAGVASIVVFIFFLFPVTDFDIWFHLAEGKFMLENWKFPYTDVFSYTAEGVPSYPNSWGFTAFSFAAAKLFGLQGLNLIKALVSLSVFLVICWHLYREKILNLFSLSFVVLLLFSVRDGFSLRPHTFAYLLFVVFVVLLLQYKKQKSYTTIALLAFVQFLWVNIHASFLWGVVLTGIFILSEVVAAKKVDSKNLVLEGSVLLASFLHIFYGPSYLIRIVTEYFTPSAQIPIREALRPGSETLLSPSTLLVLAAFAVVLYFAFRKKHFDILFSALFFGIVALSGARFMRDLVLFLSITAPAYFPVLQDQFQRFHFKIPKVPEVALRVLFFGFLLLIVVTTKREIGLGLEKFAYPVKAVEFLRQERVLEKSQGRLYHTYNFGGYLMWANQPHQVFIDGRARPYLGNVFNRYWVNFEGADAWKDTVARYKITAALVTLPHTDRATIYNDSSRMFPKEEWALVYFDDTAVVYLKRMDELKDLIEKYEYKILNPQMLDITYLQTEIQSQEQFEKVLQEIQKGLSLNPDSFRLHFTLAYVWSLAGAEQQMVDELNKTLQINPRFQAAKNILKTLNSSPTPPPPL